MEPTPIPVHHDDKLVFNNCSLSIHHGDLVTQEASPVEAKNVQESIATRYLLDEAIRGYKRPDFCARLRRPKDSERDCARDYI